MEKVINFNKGSFSDDLLELVGDKMERMDRVIVYKKEEGGKASVKFVFTSKKLSLIRNCFGRNWDIQETHGGDVLILRCNYGDRNQMEKSINDFFKEKEVHFHNVCDSDIRAEYVICEHVSKFKK